MNQMQYNHQPNFDSSILNFLQSLPSLERRESLEIIRPDQHSHSPSNIPRNSLQELQSPGFKPPPFKDKFSTYLTLQPRDEQTSPFKLHTPTHGSFDLFFNSLRKSLSHPKESLPKASEESGKGAGPSNTNFDLGLAGLSLQLHSPGVLLSAKGFLPGPLDSSKASQRYQAFTFDDEVIDNHNNQEQDVKDNPEKKVKKD